MLIAKKLPLCRWVVEGLQGWVVFLYLQKLTVTMLDELNKTKN
jgi:hypothetical protein